jgi:hypothetical protein
MANFWWILCRPTLLAGIVAGMALGLSAGIHEAAILYIPPILLLVAFKKIKRRVEWHVLVAWAVAGFLGAAWALYEANISQFLGYASGHYGREQAFYIPILWWKANIPGLVNACLEKLVNPYPYRWVNPLWGWMWALWVVSLAYAWVRRQILRDDEKLMLVGSSVLFISYAMLNGSKTDLYQIHLLPWCALWMVWFIRDIRRGVTLTHFQVNCLAILAAYIVALSEMTAAFFFFMIIGLRLLIPWLVKSRMRWPAAVSVLLGLVLNWDKVFVAGMQAATYLRLKPIFTIGFVVWPWIVFSLKNGALRFRFERHNTASRHTFVMLMCIGVAFFYVFEAVGFSRSGKLLLNNADVPMSALTRELYREPRVLGPPVWWIYNPNMCVRDANILAESAIRPDFDLVRSFKAYAPTRAFWPISHKDILEQINTHYQKPLFTFGTRWEFPFGPWIEIYFHGS